MPFRKKGNVRCLNIQWVRVERVPWERYHGSSTSWTIIPRTRERWRWYKWDSTMLSRWGHTWWGSGPRETWPRRISSTIITSPKVTGGWKCIWDYGQQVLVNRLVPCDVKNIVECCVALHNLLWSKNPTIQNAKMDYGDENHNGILGTWREENDLIDADPPPDPVRNPATKAAKDQGLYLQ